MAIAANEADPRARYRGITANEKAGTPTRAPEFARRCVRYPRRGRGSQPWASWDDPIVLGSGYARLDLRARSLRCWA